MLNCPECGLTITDTHKNCPKCRTKIEDMQIDSPEVGKKKSKKNHPKDRINQQIKEEKIEAVIRSEDDALATENGTEETMIAAVVEAEALAAIEEEKEEKEEKSGEKICEKCQNIIDDEQSSCPTCSPKQTVDEVQQERVTTPRTNEQANKWIAVIGYVIFFFPLIFNYYKESAFIKFHAKQATRLFLSSLILFLGLLLLRNTMDDWFLTSADDINYVCSAALNSEGEPICLPLSPVWHHGHGFAGGIFYHYLNWMLFSLHFAPFVFMIIGMINASQGEKRPLPIIGHFVKDEQQEFEQLNLFAHREKNDS